MSLTPIRLRCEHLAGPLAIASLKPRLTWILEQDKKDKDKRQTAYRIVVSSKAQGKGDLWDPGKVASDQTIDVLYDGASLKPRQQAFWRIMVWDEKNKAGKWSEEASWTAAPTAWPCEWIGFDQPANEEKLPDFVGTHWINHPDDQLETSPVGTFFIRRVITIDEPAPTRIDFILTVDDFFIARINGVEVGRTEKRIDAWKSPVYMKVTDNLIVGKNTIEIEMRSSGVGPTAAVGKMVFWRGGQSGELVTDAIWSIRRESESEYQQVRVLGKHGVSPWQGLRLPMHQLPAPRALRKEFNVSKKVKRSLLYATALGLYETEINGQRVSDEWLAPGWTNYKIRLHYRAYDVTKLVVQGANAMGVTLSDGWFAGFVGFGKRNHYGDHTRFKGMLWMDYEDGTSDVVATDESWRATSAGRREADLLMGEKYDSKRALPNFSRSGAVEADWHPVAIGAEIFPTLEPYPMPACETYRTISAKSVTKMAEGRYVFDLGVNFAGVVTLSLKGMNGGELVVMRHGEILKEDGTVYVENLRTALATDTFIAAPGNQEWTPRATFHGFRYVQLDGDVSVDESTIVGHAISNAQEPTSGFSCSEPRLNTLWENIDRTFRSNFIEVPTDCPQRDERMGWTGDIQVFCRTSALLADSQAFLDKWLVDLTDGQEANGNFPQVAPVIYDLNDGGPGWADAGTFVPWDVYEVYEDKQLLRRHYDSMKRFVGFNMLRSGGTGLPPDKFHCYGDWVNVNSDTPFTVLFSAFLARSIFNVARSAKVLGFDDDYKHYSAEWERVSSAFVEKFVDADGWVEGKTQCGQVVGLKYVKVGGDFAQKMVDRLMEDVEAKGHLTTGFVGTRDLMLTLRTFGRSDLAYKLLLRDEYPGWLFSIKHGATSIWERWNAWTPTEGLAGAGMNSFAHYAFGAVGQFMMETIGGIRLLDPGYRRVLIHVEPGPLVWADCWYDSPRGRIAVSWKISGGGIEMNVEVPPNVTAIVRLPDGDQAIGSGAHSFILGRASIPASRARG